MLVYYGSIFILSTDQVAKSFQNEARGLVVDIFQTGFAWVIILVVPFFALIPDFLMTCVKAVFRPTPVQHHRLLSVNPNKAFIE